MQIERGLKLFRKKGVLDTVEMAKPSGKFTSDVWAKKTTKYVKEAQKLSDEDWRAILNGAYAYMYTLENVTDSESDSSSSSSSDMDQANSEVEMDVDPDWDDANKEAWGL